MRSLRLKDVGIDDNIRSLYKDKYITDAIKQDNRECIPVRNNLVSYVSTFVDNEFMGAFLFIRYSRYEAEIHSLLKRKALNHSRDLAKLMIDYTFKDKDIMRITTLILSDLNKVKNFVRKLGFTHEGTKRNVTLRNKKCLDVDIFGIIREEIK